MAPLKIVCIGDSLTEGWGIPDGMAWPDLLSKEAKFEIINSGISGDTTGGMLARFHEMVISHHPDYVIIMGGTNDISMNIQENLVISNILAMTRLARHHHIQSIIGIPTPYFLPLLNEEDWLFMDMKTFHKRLLDYYKQLKAFIADDDQPFIDFSVNMTAELFLEDGLHPNTSGHLSMFKTAKQSILSITA